jgi:ElaB/YqjD/DUF883 family membrane-anchored ribosome-binding protein
VDEKDVKASGEQAAGDGRPETEVAAQVQAAEQELKRARQRLRQAKKNVRAARRRAGKQGEPATGRDSSFGDVLDRTLSLVKKHPGIGIAAAAAAGFLLGRLFRRW